MLGALLGLAALVALIAAAGGAKSGSDAQRALIPGHRYKMTFRATDTRRKGAPFAALEALTGRLSALGWTSTFLEPQDTEPDPFLWNAEAIWSGSRPQLLDGQGIFFLGAQDVTDRADHHGRFDADLPPAEEEAVNRALQFETDPQKLRDFANSLRPQFPIAADNLETRANALAVNPNTPPFVPPPPAPTPAPPPFVPPPPAPTPTPDSPVVPGVEPGTVGTQTFNPGPMPKLPTIPQAGKVDTSQHRKGQRGLVAFYTNVAITDPDPAENGAAILYLPSEVDGIIGPKTQKATWAFQRWMNANRNAGLVEDGLFGTNTYAALAQFGG